jgi:hypothetical protein
MWRAWDGAIPVESSVPVMVNLLLIAAGFVTLSTRKGLGGIVPFLVTIGFYLVSSAVRVSGGRFVQTIDWIWIVYFSAGLEQLIEWMVSSFREGKLTGWLFDGAPKAAPPLHSTPVQGHSRLWAYTGIGLVIFLLGASLPLVESAIKPRYTRQTEQAWLEELKQSEALRQDHPAVLTALDKIQSGQLLVLQGRALYPRYYASGEGEPGTAVTPFTPTDFARFSFYLVGPKNMGVMLPLMQQPAVAFPDATDVLVIGCQENRYLRALLVYYKTPETVLVSAPYPDSLACPPQSTP